MTKPLIFGQEIIRIGNSIGVLIPAYFLKDNNFKKGDVVKVTIEKVKK